MPPIHTARVFDRGKSIDRSHSPENRSLHARQNSRGVARKAFATACRRAEIKDLHFHDLRHTATTRMIRAGVPHAEVMKITGHTQMRTFMRYLNLVDESVQNTANILAEYLTMHQP